MNYKNRRSFLKKISLALTSIYVGISSKVSFGQRLNSLIETMDFKQNFSKIPDRVWLGENFWSIPLEDWRIKDGRAECIGEVRNSRVNVLTSTIADGKGDIKVSAQFGFLDEKAESGKGSAGFKIGVHDPIDSDIKASCYYGEGLKVGVSLNGEMFIEDKIIEIPSSFDFSEFTLNVQAKCTSNNTNMVAICKDKNGILVELNHSFPYYIHGIVNVVNNFSERNGANVWFNNLTISGSKLEEKKENAFGPLLWSMYTLSRNELNISVQMPPIGDRDEQYVDLYLKENGTWTKKDSQAILKDSYTAHFKIENWESQIETPYQLRYINNSTTYRREGIIASEPTDRPLRFGGLTCQEWGGYPYSPLVARLKEQEPDILYFSGDQLYEGNGGYPIKREPENVSILSYLGKWYMFGWAFGELMKNVPTICTPDDHDVFQGNFWGEGGRLLTTSEWVNSPDDHGGFAQSAKMLNVVAKTQCGHLPKPYDSNKLYSGLDTWYTDLVYGKISFAIISDRLFKSGPEIVRSGEERLDHIKHPLNDGELEDRNLTLLGFGQMQFLEKWVEDWDGANMKVLLSQTLFANVGTHHGPDKMFLYGDMDSGGWPKQRRDEVLRLIRKASTFHINGDQHLPFIVQYSLENARDAGWTYCTPAISTGYIRWGQPDLVNSPYTDRPEHGFPNTGQYKDGFGNSNYIYAVGNPLDDYIDENRYQQSQKKASGFGIINLDPNQRTIEMNAYRFLSNSEKNSPLEQFPGWPLTISQADNDGRKPFGYLPNLKTNKDDQILKIFDGDTQELISVMRINGNFHSPVVYNPGNYRIIVGEGNQFKELAELKITESKSTETIEVVL